VPVLNPDGMLAAKPRRVNANGVDLNRNFPTPR
jgi:murein tripeptide amidase MpaA